MPTNPCWTEFKLKNSDLYKTLKEKTSYDGEGKVPPELLKSIKELQDQAIENVNKIFEQLGGDKKTAEPPKEPPPEPPKNAPEDRETRNKALATRLVTAKGTPEAAKEGIKKEGLEYKPQSQEEAEALAKSIVDELGIDEAVKKAQAQDFGGDVNTLVQTESLNRLYDKELAAKTSEEKFSVAQDFADIAIKLDEWARDKAGRGISALNYFYKKSPLGMAIKHNKENKKSFDKWAKPKEQSWDEYLEELNNLPEFKVFVDKKVQEEVKAERAESRKSRIKKVDDTIDGWIKDIQSGKTLFALPVPPPIIIAALKGAKLAYKGGELVAKIIEDAISYISKELGDSDWNQDNLRKKLQALYGGERKSSLDRYKDRLNDQISDLDRQIENRKRDNKKTNKTELDAEANELIKKRDEKKKQLEDIAPLSETQEYQLSTLEKFRKRLKGLSEEQKDEVIRKSHQELIKNGALKQEDFRKIIANATGRGDLTPQQSAKMKELVGHTNAVETFAKRLQERKTPKDLENYHKAQMRAAQAAKDLSDMFDKKADYLKVIAASVQGTTLTATNVLVSNPLFNILNQLSTRLPIGALQSLYGVMSGKAQFNTVLSKSAQRQFFREVLKGVKEANIQLVTGMNRMDYSSKEIFTDQIRPFRSARALGHQVRSSKFGNAVARMFGGKEVERKERLSSSQKVHRALQIFPGTPAELIFRLLNYGDKPMRFGAGGSTAAAFANSLGIKTGTMNWDIFMEFPREEAYRILKPTLGEKKAAERADYIKESIIQEGKRSTLQQDNLFTDAINRVFGGGARAESGAASLAKTSLISPYIKIPSNAFWSYFNVAHPLIAVAQSTGHLINAKRLRSNGENVKADLQLREARYWAGHAAVGIALNMIVIPLVKSGVITASSDDDDPKKEREGKRTYEQQGTIRFGNVRLPLKLFGTFGMLGNSVAKDYEQMTEEQRESRDLLLMNLFEFWDTDDLRELQNGIFSNSSGLLGALGEGGTSTDRFLINQINMYANLVHPAAVAQISRAQLPYYTTRKADSFAEELDNSLLERSSWYRGMRDKYPPTKYNIWGDPMMKDKSFIFRIFGFSRINKDDNFSQPLYEDAKKYNDNGFFPPAIDDKVNGIKLNAEQYEDRQKFIGEARKKYFAAFANDLTKIPVVNKTYSELESPEAKKLGVEYFSTVARGEGDKAMIEKYPELEKKEKSIQEEVEENLLRIGLKIMAMQTQYKK